MADNIFIFNRCNIHDNKIKDAIRIADNIPGLDFSCIIQQDFIIDNLGIYCIDSRLNSILVYKQGNGGLKNGTNKRSDRKYEGTAKSKG